MGQILHGSATTTHAVRAAIQRSQASIAELSRRYRINPKTVAKWRSRGTVADAPMGPTCRVWIDAVEIVFPHTPLNIQPSEIPAAVSQWSNSDTYRPARRIGSAGSGRPRRALRRQPLFGNQG
jgi:hypothetical protein